MSAVVMLSSTLSGVCNPLLLSYLFQQGVNAGFSYTLMAEACLGLLVILALYVLSRSVRASWRRDSARNTLEEGIVSEQVGEVRDNLDRCTRLTLIEKQSLEEVIVSERCDEVHVVGKVHGDLENDQH